MNRTAFLISLATVMLCQQLIAAWELIPIDPNKFPEYRALWKSKLERTPFDCGRVVILPAFEFERSISIYSRSARGQREYRITYVWPETQTNLWEVSGGGQHPNKAKSIKTRQIDADVPKTTALLLQALWSRILKASEGPLRSPGSNEEVVGLDTADFEWSMQQNGRPPLECRRNTRAKVTPRLRRLAEFSNVTLPAYCKRTPQGRAQMIPQIEKQAKRLLNDWGD
jgi:hypothetical protein